MESERILLRVDNLSLVLHVVVNISSDLFTMSFSPLPLLHRSSVLSIATSPALLFVLFPSHPSQLQPWEAMVLAATQIIIIHTTRLWQRHGHGLLRQLDSDCSTSQQLHLGNASDFFIVGGSTVATAATIASPGNIHLLALPLFTSLYVGGPTQAIPCDFVSIFLNIIVLSPKRI